MTKHERVTALIYDFFVKETQRTPDLRAGWEQIAPLAVQSFNWHGLAHEIIRAMEEQQNADDLIITESNVSIGCSKKEMVLTKATPKYSINLDLAGWGYGELGKGLWIEVDRQTKMVEIGFNEDVTEALIIKRGIESFFDGARWSAELTERGLTMRATFPDTARYSDDDENECEVNIPWDDIACGEITRDSIVAVLQSLRFDEEED